MDSMLILLAAGLCGPAVSQQYEGAYELPTGSAPGILAPPALFPATGAFHYAPEFREFHPLVPTNFINIDSRSADPPRFYYESTLYMPGRPYGSFELPVTPVYYEPPPPSMDFPPGNLPAVPSSDRPGASPLYPSSRARPGSFFDSGDRNYAGSRSFQSAFGGREPPQVYETPPPQSYRPKPPLSPSTSPNIIRDDETSASRNSLRPDDVGDDRVGFFLPTEPPYEIKSTTPQFVTSVSTVNSNGNSQPPYIADKSYFVPSLFDTRPTAPSRSSGVFLASDPNIVRGETSPSPSTVSPPTLFSTAYPGHDVPEQVLVPGRTLNDFIPLSSTGPPHLTSSGIGLFSPKMFSPSFHPTPPEGPNHDSPQSNVIFEAPGHDHPK